MGALELGDVVRRHKRTHRGKTLNLEIVHGMYNRGCLSKEDANALVGRDNSGSKDFNGFNNEEADEDESSDDVEDSD